MFQPIPLAILNIFKRSSPKVQCTNGITYFFYLHNTTQTLLDFHNCFIRKEGIQKNGPVMLYGPISVQYKFLATLKHAESFGPNY